MGEVIEFKRFRVMPIGDDLMLDHTISCEQWAQEFAKRLIATGFNKGDGVFFKIGIINNGKFVPYEGVTESADPTELMEIYFKLRANGQNEFVFCVCQEY